MLVEINILPIIIFIVILVCVSAGTNAVIKKVKKIQIIRPDKKPIGFT